MKLSWDSKKLEPPKPFPLEVEQTREELYNDWNKRINKFGLIKKEDGGT